MLHFDDRTIALAMKKRRNFYAALAFTRHYPKARQMQKVLCLSRDTFMRLVRPTDTVRN